MMFNVWKELTEDVYSNFKYYISNAIANTLFDRKIRTQN